MPRSAVMMSPRGMFLVGHLVFDAIKDLKADGIGGLTFGADPVAVATAFVSELKDTNGDGSLSQEELCMSKGKCKRMGK